MTDLHFTAYFFTASYPRFRLALYQQATKLMYVIYKNGEGVRFTEVAQETFKALTSEQHDALFRLKLYSNHEYQSLRSVEAQNLLFSMFSHKRGTWMGASNGYIVYMPKSKFKAVRLIGYCAKVCRMRIMFCCGTVFEHYNITQAKFDQIISTIDSEQFLHDITGSLDMLKFTEGQAFGMEAIDPVLGEFSTCEGFNLVFSLSPIKPVSDF